MLKIYYPINLDIIGKKCLVVGGGSVAERKVRSLLKFSAVVKVVSPEFTPHLLKLKRTRKVYLIKRKFKNVDLQGISLVIAATNDSNLNQKISKLAKKNNILINVVDKPKLCSFIVPSIIKRGPLVVSISTSGLAPALAKALRIKLEKIITPAYGVLAVKMGKKRKRNAKS